MNKFFAGIILLAVLPTQILLADNDHVPSSDEFQATQDYTGSNQFQEQIDEGNISDEEAYKVIDNGDFDLNAGGLYCPNNDCESDPDDVSNGF